MQCENYVIVPESSVSFCSYLEEERHNIKCNRFHKNRNLINDIRENVLLILSQFFSKVSVTKGY